MSRITCAATTSEQSPRCCTAPQFAVEPSLQKRGIGLELLRKVERYAGEHGKTELACDTAQGARPLREYYARRGFREVGIHRYLDANYTSVILSKTLTGDS